MKLKKSIIKKICYNKNRLKYVQELIYKLKTYLFIFNY